MIIDGHSHVTLPVTDHIKVMDNAEVDMTILFSTTFHPETSKNISELKASMKYLDIILAGKTGSMIEIRKKAILELTDAIHQYPSRFIGFGAVPVGLNFETTLQYIEENIQRNHLVGIGEFTVGHGQIHLLENIFKASQQFNNLPIWIHAFFPLDLQDIRQIANYAKHFPEIPVILGHLGGCNWLETMNIVKEISNLYLDTSASYSTFVLGTVINELPHKCLWEVDLPFDDLKLSKKAILTVAKSQAIVNAVLGENIAALLRI